MTSTPAEYVPEEMPGGSTSHVAGYGRVRRLGHFDGTPPVDDDARPVKRRKWRRGSPDAQGEEQAVRTPFTLSRVVAALIVLTVGVLSLSTGIAFAVDWAWGLVTFGVLVTGFGILLASDS